MSRAVYRSLKRYKYQLMEDYQVQTPIAGYSINQPYLILGRDGTLLIEKGYCWDGPSGPTWDTRNSMRGALVHDALYQLLRMGLLHKGCRELADIAFRSILLEDGMSRIRAAVWYRSVRWFAGWAARRGTQNPTKLIRTPLHRKSEVDA